MNPRQLRAKRKRLRINREAKRNAARARKLGRIVRSFSVDRRRWMRGESSRLFHPVTKKRDILGFYLKAVGVDDYQMEWISDPTMIWGIVPEQCRWIFDADLAWFNDTEKLSDAVRETKLIGLFHDQGIVLKFIY